MKSKESFFNTEYETTAKNFDEYVKNLDLDQSLNIINLALANGQRHGIFTIVESELISKAMRVIVMNLTPDNDEVDYTGQLDD